jgi:hypothetical protein
MYNTWQRERERDLVNIEVCSAMAASFSIFQPYRGDPSLFETGAVMTYTGNFQT